MAAQETLQAEPLRATVDSFFRGAFVVVQPAAGAHRAGMDALVLASALPAGFSGRVADFGAGAGAAGLAAAARLTSAQVCLVEKAPDMARFAAQSIVHPGNAGLAPRLSLLIADATLRGEDRHAAGLRDRSFDAVIMNPPFNDPRDRVASAELKRLAHAAVPDLFEGWLRSAAAVLVPNGIVALIARPESLGDVLAALTGRFGGVRIVPIQADAAAPAIRVVIRAHRGSRGRTALLAPLVLRERGCATDRADAIANGRAGLLDD
jgi:tRNA1(Val) A37 N6-methylase TrmN6